MAQDSAMIAVQVGHQVDVIRFGASLGANVNPYLSSISKQIREILTRNEYINTAKLRDEIVREVTAVMNKELGAYTAGLESDLNPLISSEVAFQYEVVNAAVGKGVAVARPTIAETKKLINKVPMSLNGKAYYAADRIGNYAPTQISAVEQVIVSGWSTGQTTTQISRAITGTANVRGVIQTSQNSAYSLAKDLTSHISSMAKTEVGKQNNDLVIGEKAVVTLDSKTSHICQDIGSQDSGGKEYYYDKDGYNFPRSPYHHNCRTTMTYILADEYRDISDEDQSRPAVVNGKVIQVDATTNWMDLAKQYPSLARQSLGASRAAVLNEMTASEFTKVAYNRMNQPITLDQLARNNATAAKVLTAE